MVGSPLNMTSLPEVSQLIPLYSFASLTVVVSFCGSTVLAEKNIFPVGTVYEVCCLNWA